MTTSTSTPWRALVTFLKCFIKGLVTHNLIISSNSPNARRRHLLMTVFLLGPHTPVIEIIFLHAVEKVFKDITKLYYVSI